ncbi:MAG: mechanosensitive ion channel [Flavobacteriales bacterium]|nr:mechanosensitive ion channel [Flavobacteriales bacterium]
MDTFWERTFYSNTFSEWAIALGIAVGAILAAKTLYWVIGKVLRKIVARTSTRLDDLLLDALEGPVVALVGIWGFRYALQGLHMSVGLSNWTTEVFRAATALVLTWFAARISVALIDHYLRPIVERSKSDLDDQLLPVIRKGSRSIIWVLGILVALNNAGYNVGALLAGLGLGGLALAMAAKDTVSNIFGGISVFVDKPFMVNDRIKIEGFDGIVTEVGIRSTRIRTLEGRLLTIPNHKFTDSVVENVTAEPSRKVVHQLGLTYDTSAERMELALQVLEGVIGANQDKLEPDHLISFNTFGDFSLGILFIYYIRKDQDIFLTQSFMSLEILKAFNANGLAFAFPTQTVHLEKDPA